MALNTVLLLFLRKMKCVFISTLYFYTEQISFAIRALYNIFKEKLIFLTCITASVIVDIVKVVRRNKANQG